ncbi:hypothetical protein NDK47_27560 (plasmid) [Brevibacillus ruminantium]|uniref:Uncharacterized protein n=1 Tax=Brevibacillus ruminantium TaxID=2950604 RepID=A0ABY4WRN3_9BACL|nr:hypothetical protein [Brevibacillus ruminantium]USG68560.1 hypothetical protein NDK47_27560 [Brevibacillus ruminantium]
MSEYVALIEAFVVMAGASFLFHLFWSFFWSSTTVTETVVHVDNWEAK